MLQICNVTANTGRQTNPATPPLSARVLRSGRWGGSAPNRRPAAQQLTNNPPLLRATDTHSLLDLECQPQSSLPSESAS